MPLEPTNLPPRHIIGGVQFPMNNGDKVVVVVITHEALENVVSFEAFRSKIELIASRKYDIGQTYFDGSICVTSDDLVDFL
jgi:hypothetical protein